MKMTIAQKRYQEVKRLAAYGKKSPDENLRDAERLMNSFYRYVPFSIRVFEWSNNERFYTRNKNFVAAQDMRSYEWFMRLRKQFNDLFGLTLMEPGLYPIIVNGSGYIAINTYYYND